MHDTNALVGQLEQALAELLDFAQLRPGNLVVLGCSTSEVAGGQIGKMIQPQLGVELIRALLDALQARGLRLAVQCCEHLNRALVLERETLEALSLRQVAAVPYPDAGGSAASAAWRLMKDPVLAESVQAAAGIDIGDTLIGMHLRPVAVPFRGTVKKLGQANLVMASTRPPFIGGNRAHYRLDD